MKNLNLLSFLIAMLFFLNATFAQELNLTWGVKGKTGFQMEQKAHPIGWYNDNYYIIKDVYRSNVGNRLYIEKIDNKLNLIFSKKMKQDASSIQSFKLENGKIVQYGVGSTSKNPRAEKAIFNLDGAYIKTENIGNLEFTTFHLNIQNNGFSKNKKYFGAGSASTQSKENSFNISIYRVDTESNKLSSAAIDVSFSSESSITYVRDVTIQNDGTMYIALQNYEVKSKTITNRFLFMDSGGKLIEMEDLEFGGFSLRKIEISSSSGSETFFTGMYAVKEKKKSNYLGFFIGKMDNKTGVITKLKPIPFDDEFFSSLGYKRKKDGGLDFKGSYMLYIKTTNEDGGYIIASHSITNGRKELVIYPFNQNLDILDRAIIPRGQYTSKNFKGIGEFTHIYNDKLILLYNDAEANLNVEIPVNCELSKDFDKSNVATYLVTVNKSGQVNRELLFNNKNEGGYFLPEKCFADEEKILLGIRDGKNLRFGKLDF